jgi:pre-mRNA-splicing factor ISY1
MCPVPLERASSYRYFQGCTKFLPDVKELFDKPPEVKKRRSRYEIYK